MKKESSEPKIINKKEIIGHTAILIILSVICLWDRIVNIPKFPKNFLFLTQIDLYLSMLYYTISLIGELKNKNPKKQYQKFFNFIFCVSFLVCVMFWAMFFLARNTIYSEKNKKEIAPLPLNILLHGGVFTLNLLEQVIINPRIKPTYFKFFNYFLFELVYLGTLYFVKFVFQIKIYPFIYGGLLKLLIVAVAGFLVCFIGHLLYYWLTSKNRKIELSEKGKELIEK